MVLQDPSRTFKIKMMTVGKTTESSSSREMGSRMTPRTQLRKK
jgi:hypothetical protein